jgi:hypothetical protein
MQYRRSQAFITELETSAFAESKRMTNHNTPQLSRMDLANHCAAFPGLSLLNTRTVVMTSRLATVGQTSPCQHVRGNVGYLVTWNIFFLFNSINYTICPSDMDNKYIFCLIYNIGKIYITW